MLSQLRTLSLFADVANHRHLATGAGNHGMSQGAASQRIQQLERELGVSLFDRNHRPLELTAAGKVFLNGCKDLLQRADRLEHTVRAAADAIVGDLNVASIYSAGIEILERAREQLEQQHEQCQISIRYRTPDDVQEQIMAGHCEIGIVSFPQRFRSMEYQLLRDEPLVFACAPDHPMAGSEPLDVHALDNQALLVLASSLPLSREISQYLRNHGVSIQVGDSFDNIDTLMHAIAPCRRPAILPAPAVAPWIESGQLVARPMVPHVTRPVGIIYSRQYPLSPLAEAFANAVEQLMHPPEIIVQS